MPIIPLSGSAVTHGALVPFGFYRTVTGDSATITFHNLPQNCTDIYFVVSSGSTINTDMFAGSTLYLNNQGNNTTYSLTTLSGNGATLTSSRNTAPYGFNFTLPTQYLPSSIYASTVGHIFNYTNATTFKTLLSRTAIDANGSGYSQAYAQLYRLTGAITRLDFVCSGGWYPATTFAIYGIRSANQ
jgi:hypothetical protein